MTTFRERLPRHLVSIGVGMVLGGIVMLSPPAHAAPVRVDATDGTFPLTCVLVGQHLSCDGDLPTAGPTTPPTTEPPTTPPTTVPPTTVPPTTTPPPTTGPQLNCLSQPSRCGFPDATNTGPADGTFTVMNSLTANVAGRVYDHIQVNGCTVVTAPNVTIRNSRLLGNGDCFYAVNNKSSGLRLDHDEISCSDSPNTGVTSDNYAISFSNIHGCENGLNVGSTGNMSLTDSWVHNMFRGQGSHTDGVQIGQGAANLVFKHNTIAMSTDDNAAIIMWDEGNPQNSNLQVTNNLLTGGGFTVYCPRANANNVTVIGNRFGTFAFGFSNGCTTGHATWLNNVRDSTGATIGPA